MPIYWALREWLSGRLQPSIRRFDSDTLIHLKRKPPQRTKGARKVVLKMNENILP